MLVEYVCCPRCLGDLVVEDRTGVREFACLQCGDSGEVVPADEYVARNSERVTYRRREYVRRPLTTA